MVGNTWIASMKRSSAVATVAVLIIGRMMCRTTCRGRAPSTTAASRSSAGIPASAARVSKITNGVYCLTSTPTITAIAEAGSVSHSCSIPIRPR